MDIFPIEKLPIDILSEILLYCCLFDVERVNKLFLMATRLTIKNIYNEIKQVVSVLKPKKIRLIKSQFENVYADVILQVEDFNTINKINIGQNYISLKDHNEWWKYFWFRGIKVYCWSLSL